MPYETYIVVDQGELFKGLISHCTSVTFRNGFDDPVKFLLSPSIDQDIIYIYLADDVDEAM